MSDLANKTQIKQLLELNDELENYFRNTIIPQLFVDANLILRKFTPPAMKQFKLNDLHIGKHMDDIVDNIRFSTIVENIHQVIQSGEILEKEIQTSDLRWFQMNIIPYVIKKENKLNGVIITFIDITDRIKDLKDLEMLNASHETFIYSVSHDLKAPLANIEALVGILIHTSEELAEACEENNEEQKGISTMLQKSITSMRTIINELTEITKIEGNYNEIEEQINIQNILEQVQLTIKDKIVESQAIIHTDFKVLEFKYSKKNLRSILYNLLSNAIKYKSIDKAPEIFISTHMQDGFSCISVKDNGLGIATEEQSKIFAQFSRLQKNVEGTGIGLYLIKKIIENGGGKIELKSASGQGSEFIVYLKSNK